MLAYVAIVHAYFFKILVASFKGEACKDKFVPGKTPRSVCHFWIFGKCNCRIGAVLACSEFDSVPC